ncbi:MAG: AlkZ family DNA glycosylase [Myxococcales bacterium]|nr:AlkZ family DNA glycosylase [Myxococcales bacterium]
MRALLALHSSDPITPYLALRARVPGFAVASLEHALYQARSLWRMHGMRRTLFVVDSDDALLVGVAAARPVAAKERQRLEGWLAPLVEATAGWLADVERSVLGAIAAAGGEPSTAELCESVPALATKITVGSGKWTQDVPLASRLLLVLAMEGKIVRTRTAGTWRASQYRWANTASWFAERALRKPADEASARAALLRRYVETHGPVTMTDLRWWTGWSKSHVTAALAANAALTVALDDGAEGYVLPGDESPRAGPPRGVALLPGLDSTPMGYKERAFFLPEPSDVHFDRSGNIGPTVWLDGRVVGVWAQRTSGEVAYRLLEDIGTAAQRDIAQAAAELTRWMDGVVATPRFRTPLERELAGT